MIIVDKNLSHGSGVVLSRDFYKGDKTSGNYFKSSSVTDGIQNIKRELEGFSWYLKRSGYHYEFDILQETDRYIKVRYPRVIGSTPDNKRGYVANISFIEEVVKHYITVWPPYTFTEMGPVHGDLSLAGNVIFTVDGPFIIDWEHFSFSGAPIGFDALYFLFELLWFGGKRKKPDQSAMGHLRQMIRLLEKEDRISGYFKGGYLSKTIDFINSNKSIWGTQKYKIPLRFFDQSVVEFIDANLQLVEE